MKIAQECEVNGDPLLTHLVLWGLEVAGTMHLASTSHAQRPRTSDRCSGTATLCSRGWLCTGRLPTYLARCTESLYRQFRGHMR